MEEAPPLLRQVLELVPDPALIRRRRDGVIVEANPGFADLVGRSPAELAGEPLDALDLSFAPGEREAFLRRLEDGGRVESHPVRVRLDGGRDEEQVHLISSRTVEIDGEPCVLSVSKDITDRKAAQEQLRTSRERYRTLFELSRDGIFVCDETGTVLEVNERAADLTGFGADELVGASVLELHPPEVRPDARSAVDRTLRDGGGHFELRFRRPDGEEWLGQIATSRFRVEGQAVFQAVVRDVTEQRRREEALRRSERRLREAQAMAHVGNWEWYPERDRLHWSEEEYRIFGYEPGEVDPDYDTFLQRVHPGDRERVDRATRDLLRGEEATADLQFRVVRPDGETGWVRERSRTERGPDGTVRRMVGVTQEITAKVAARRQVEDQRSRLGQILRTTAAGILMTDAEGDFRYANPAAEEMLGLEGSDIRSRSYDDPRWRIFGPEGGDFPEEELPVARVLREGRAVRGVEHGVVRPDGSRVVLSVNAAPLTDSEGEITGVVASIRDVTEEKRREERLRKSEKRYRDLFEHNVAGAFRSTPEGEILDCNAAFAEIFGYDGPEELEGRDATILYPSEADRDRYQEQLRDEGRLVNEELQLERRDGSPVWVLENSVVTEDPETGDPVNQGTLVDITERKRAETRLEEMVYRDPLTGLGNRRLLEDRAESLLSLADRHEGCAGLAYLDLDRFQEVNDRWGHGTGDAVLREVAARLERESRETDLLARVGGDEFVLLLADLDDPDQALTTTRRITTAFDVPFAVGDQEISLGASAGVAVYPDDAGDLEALLRRADRALYRADQRSGGLARYRSDIDVSLSDEAGFERRIRRALEEGEMALHYQPIHRLRDGAGIGVEALLRWEHPDRGLLPAGDFVPRAERTGVIRAIDAWVIRRAVGQLTEWQGEGSGPSEVSVNLSAASFRDPGVVRRISAALEEADPRDRAGLVIEITEAEAMEDPAVAGELLRSFRETGVRVALDDFGTGHSSLSYLDQFPVDRIKLDRRFISKLDPETGDTSLVEAMLELARKLELETVAEGVEEERQRRWLAAAGADLAQGFLLERPLPAARIEALWGGGPSA